ncbi:MAG: sensor histidine kinase, partial [Deltaproteobacteria bacterium]
FARGETTVLMRRVYLHRFLADLVEQLRHDLAGRNVEVALDMEYRGVAYFDEAKIRRLAHNLARNAAQALGRAGGRFSIAARAAGDRLELVFADNGPGIPDEMRGRLFEPFTSGTEGGTGLGLAIVKKIVDEHNGTIEVDSRAGEGTTFTVSLPLERPEGVRDSSERPVPGELRGG